MYDKDIPIEFNLLQRPKALLIRIGIGAAIGAMLGAAVYMNDRYRGQTILWNVNQMVKKEYHPHVGETG